MNLKAIHRALLVDLVEAGSGTLDPSGRVCVGPLRRPLLGDSVAWLVLMSQGLVAGERGHIIPTEAGREYVMSSANGRVREA